MTKLTDAIRAIIDEAQRLSVDDFEAAINAASDDLQTGERDDDLYIESVLDGIRWGVRAAVVVDFGGGAMVRVYIPDGGRITHEWQSHRHAKPQIEAALDVILVERVMVANAGDDPVLMETET